MGGKSGFQKRILEHRVPVRLGHSVHQSGHEHSPIRQRGRSVRRPELQLESLQFFGQPSVNFRALQEMPQCCRVAWDLIEGGSSRYHPCFGPPDANHRTLNRSAHFDLVSVFHHPPRGLIDLEFGTHFGQFDRVGISNQMIR